MKNFRYFAQRYVDWVIRLGRVRFSFTWYRYSCDFSYLYTNLIKYAS